MVSARLLRALPNMITLLRCLLAFLIGGLILGLAPESGTGKRLDEELQWHLILPSALFLITALSDFLDGYLARRFQAVTAFGAFLDPIADKLLVGISLIALCLLLDWPLLIALPAWLIISRDVALTLLRLNTARAVPVSQLAKVKTAVELAAIGLMLFSYMAAELIRWTAPELISAWPLQALVFQAGLVLLWLAAGLALWTGYVYFRPFLSR